VWEPSILPHKVASEPEQQTDVQVNNVIYKAILLG